MRGSISGTQEMEEEERIPGIQAREETQNTPGDQDEEEECITAESQGKKTMQRSVPELSTRSYWDPGSIWPQEAPGLQECKDIGFDTLELNVDLLNFQEDDFLRLIRLIRSEGLKAKPQLDVRIEDANSLKDVQKEMDAFIKKAKRFLEDGADMIMFDADGITKGVDEWRTDLVAKMIGRPGLHPPFPPGISPYALVEV
ncbi:hypothetical protein L7F22_027872 [Adiantum nelumboides]|nr:hypothetical protein [Adiantum nelumboides]